MGWNIFGRDSKEDDEDVFRHFNKEFWDSHNKRKQEMDDNFSNSFISWLGSVIGIVLFVFLISLCCACCRRRRRGLILSRGPHPVIQAVPVSQPHTLPIITTVPHQQVPTQHPVVPMQHPVPTAPVRPSSLPPTYDQAVGMYERTPPYNPNVPR